MMRRQAGLTFRFPNKAAPYADALRLAGIEPVLISPENPRPLHGLQGLLLSGGTDLDPARYGAAALPGNEHPDNQRDVLESGLLADALAADLPVLAICRGMQLFNVFHGGTLVQHLDNADFHRVRGGHPELPVHQILVEPGTRLAAILGAGRHGVNSRHHQAVDRIGGGLLVTARSIPDGVVEALERADRRFALAVQWHPEDQIVHDQPQLNLFEAFAEALG